MRHMFNYFISDRRFKSFHPLKLEGVVDDSNGALISTQGTDKIQMIIPFAAITASDIDGGLKSSYGQRNTAMIANGIFVGENGIETRSAKNIGQSFLEIISAILTDFRKDEVGQIITDKISWVENHDEPIKLNQMDILLFDDGDLVYFLVAVNLNRNQINPGSH